MTFVKKNIKELKNSSESQKSYVAPLNIALVSLF